MGFMEKFSLQGKKIVVTGGAQGIGKCVAQTLADCGADIGIFDVNYSEAQAVAQEISQKYGKKALAFLCDVTAPEQVESAFCSFVEQFGTLDAVFNNAGIVLHKPAEELAPDEWLRVVQVNLNGVFFVAQSAAKQFMREGKPGSIVNTASMSGVIVNIPQCQTSYNSSKAAVIHLTKSLAVEWAKKGIRVNCISPGYIKTEMTGMVDPDWRAYWESLIPYGRMGTPEELAGAVVYLMSDASAYTSGLNMIIDGGFTCI